MSTLIAEFTVVGTPVPQGSTRAFSRGGKIHTTNDPTGTIERWRGDIRSACRAAFPRGIDFVRVYGRPLPIDGLPVSMRLSFRQARPKSHYLPPTKSRPRPELRPGAPTWGGKGDLDKLVRAALDALTGVLYVDDTQVVVIGATKEYSPAGRAGVDVRLSVL